MAFIKRLDIDYLFLTILTESTSKLIQMENLEYLKISNLELIDGHISSKLINFLVCLKNLKSLSLENCWINEQFWYHISQIDNLEYLEILKPIFNISFIFETNSFIHTKIIIKKLKGLSLVNCFINRSLENNITFFNNQNLVEFYKELGNSKIENLDLSGNKFQIANINKCIECNCINLSGLNSCWKCHGSPIYYENYNMLDSIYFNKNIKILKILGNYYNVDESLKNIYNNENKVLAKHLNIEKLNLRKISKQGNNLYIDKYLENSENGILITDNIMANTNISLLNYYLGYLNNINLKKIKTDCNESYELIQIIQKLISNKENILKVEVGNKGDLDWIVPTFNENSIVLCDSDIVITQWLLSGLVKNIKLLILPFNNILPSNLCKCKNIVINLEIGNDLSIIGQFHNQLYSSGTLESLAISLSIINTRSVQDLSIRSDILKCLLTDLLIYNSIKKLILIINEPLKSDTINIVKELVDSSMLSLSKFKNKICII